MKKERKSREEKINTGKKRERRNRQAREKTRISSH